MSLFDVEQYVKEAIKKHPKLTLVEQCDTHSCQLGHNFVVAAAANLANTAVLTTADISDAEASVAKDIIAKRMQMIADALVKKDA